MAIKARETITIVKERDVNATWRFYRIAPSTSTPTQPTEAQGKAYVNDQTIPSGWSISEPAYDGTSTNSLYTCDLTSFTDGEVSWSAVSKSSSYEAAKQAYNEAQTAKMTATNFMSADTTGIMVADMRNGSSTPSNPSGRNVLIDNDSIDIRDGQTVLASFGQTAQIGENTKTRAKFDYHSLELIDNEGSPYFHISDLRNANGIAEDVVERFIGNGTLKVFTLFGADGIQSTPTITVDGTATTAWTIDSTGTIRFTNAPAYDAEILVTYDYSGPLAKAFTLGTRSGSIGLYSYAEGYGAQAPGIMSHAEGEGIAGGYMSHAEGEGTASAEYTHAEGIGVASRRYSHAENAGISDGGYSHAEGTSTASALYSHAEGEQTLATFAGSNHAEGRFTIAEGHGAHAEGCYSKAIGVYSHAGGWRTIAQRKSQMTIGEYNEADSTGTSTGARGTYAFIIGNGTAEDARSNAFAVTWDGDSHIPAAGILYNYVQFLGWTNEVIV